MMGRQGIDVHTGERYAKLRGKEFRMEVERVEFIYSKNLTQDSFFPSTQSRI